MKIIKQSLFDKDLIFDTGIVNNVLKKNNRELKFWSDLHSINNLNSREAYFFSSIHLCLEYLGYSSSEVDPLSDASLKAKIDGILAVAEIGTISEDVTSIYNLLKEWFLHRLSYVKLIARLQQELPHKSDTVRTIFLNLFESNFQKDDFDVNTVSRLSWSALCRIRYRALSISEEVKLEIDKYLLSQSRKMLLEGYKGLQFANLADQCLLAAQGKPTDQGEYRERGEVFDLEIVHYLLVGSTQSGKHKSAVVFTTEKLQKWEARLARHMSFLKYLTERKEFFISPGIVFWIDQNTGEIKEMLNLYDSHCEELRVEGFILMQDQWLKAWI